MIPVLEARGNSIAEVWDAALLALWREGMEIRTQYDYDPFSKVWGDPSKDCTMRMVVPSSLNEPRLHICLEGGAEQLGDYETEVVLGLKDDWVKKVSTDPQWTYTYHGRLADYGNRMNFACSKENVPGKWASLAYKIPSSNGGFTYQDIDPFDQIEFMVQQIVEAPYTRRAVAITGIPFADGDTGDPPCLRQIWVRGYYEDNVLKIDMHTHWRSRDAWGAALFNMYALTELHRSICTKVENEFEIRSEGLATLPCPRCNGKIGGQDLSHDMKCEDCGLMPYRVEAGAYVDEAESFHIYGRDMKVFEERFIRGVHGIDPRTGEKIQEMMPNERRYKDLTKEPWKEMLADGYQKAIKRWEDESQ